MHDEVAGDGRRPPHCSVGSAERVSGERHAAAFGRVSAVERRFRNLHGVVGFERADHDAVAARVVGRVEQQTVAVGEHAHVPGRERQLVDDRAPALARFERGDGAVLVGRIREDNTVEGGRGLALFISGDQTSKQLKTLSDKVFLFMPEISKKVCFIF